VTFCQPLALITDGGGLRRGVRHREGTGANQVAERRSHVAVTGGRKLAQSTNAMIRR
jgi:hypothetical protein